MECIVTLLLKKDIKKDYGVLVLNPYEEGIINLGVYTNGKNPVDFRKLNYVSLSGPGVCEDFIDYFSLGRKIFTNAKAIHVEPDDLGDKITKEQCEDLVELIKLNKLEEKKTYISTGEVKINDEDIELVKPLKKCPYSLISFDSTSVYHSVDIIEVINDIIGEITRRCSKYDFSPLEKMLYAYDLLKTNFMVDKEYQAKVDRLLNLYPEPSYFYALIYNEVLKRMDIKSWYTSGEFDRTECRAMNVVRVIDEKYEIDGVFYIDIGKDSKERFNNSLVNYSEEDLKDELINNYSGFCKNKDFMVYEGSLDVDYVFGPFDKDFMETYDEIEKKYGINGIYSLKEILNNVGYFVDGRTVIDVANGIKDEAELDDIKSNVERFATLFGAEIDGEDFLEILFSVRQVEYLENKKLFQLNIQSLRDSLFKSKFKFSGMVIDLPEDQEYEEEDIIEAIEESFNDYFENSVIKNNMEDRIRKLKLSLNKDINKPNNDDNK